MVSLVTMRKSTFTKTSDLDTAPTTFDQSSYPLEFAMPA